MSTKKLGRPRTFDEDEVLDAVSGVFWEKGYEGASMRELTEATGLNKPSLYAAFGDKSALYVRALSHYAATTGSAAMKAFLAAGSIHEAVTNFLTEALEMQTRAGRPAKGCLLGNCAIASVGTVPESAALLAELDDKTQVLLAQRFESAVRKGELAAGFPAKERARLLADLMTAQASAARMGRTREELTDAIGWKQKLVLGAA